MSPGCDNCYAAALTAGRLAHVPAYQGLATKEPGKPAEFTGEIRLLRERLDQPIRWKRPRRIFVNSMSDLFHDAVPDAFIGEVFDVMLRASQHQFQVLTKRPQRMAKLVSRFRTLDGGSWFIGEAGEPMAFPTVWLGTSIENDRYAFRANHLRATPAAVRFLSIEPMLGPVPSLDLTNIDWVIVGGESGPGARPMEEAWAREVRDRCMDEAVPFFFKQAGRVLGKAWGCADSHGTDMEAWPAWARIQEYPLTAPLPEGRGFPPQIAPTHPPGRRA